MSIEFPLPQKNTPFGPVSDPKIPVAVKTLGGYRTYRFLIDTGADFALAPRRLAQQIGMNWDTCPETHVFGVEQGGVSARLGEMPVRIGNIELTIRCLFLDARKPLFILGRADFLDRFVLTVNHPQRRIILTEVPQKEAKSELWEILEKIKDFLTTHLKLRLNPIRVAVLPVERGIDFLGYVIYPDGYKRIRRRNVVNFRLRLKALENKHAQAEITFVHARQSIASWLGLAKHASAFRLSRSLFLEHDVRNIGKRLLVKVASGV